MISFYGLSNLFSLAPYKSDFIPEEREIEPLRLETQYANLKFSLKKLLHFKNKIQNA